MSNGYRTLSQHLNDLKKENFSLKLRIYFLEERMQQKYEVSREDVYKRVSESSAPGAACLGLVSCCSASGRALYLGISPCDLRQTHSPLWGWLSSFFQYCRRGPRKARGSKSCCNKPGLRPTSCVYPRHSPLRAGWGSPEICMLK